MLSASEVELLFSAMRATYGHKWPHAADAIQLWLAALRDFDRSDLQAAVGDAVLTFPDFPPTLPEFANLCRHARQDSNNRDELDEATIYANCRPRSASNPKGNLSHITLPDSIARRQSGESIERYRQRISNELQHAQYPDLRPRAATRIAAGEDRRTPAERAFDERHAKLAGKIR